MWRVRGRPSGAVLDASVHACADTPSTLPGSVALTVQPAELLNGTVVRVGFERAEDVCEGRVSEYLLGVAGRDWRNGAVA